MVLKNLRVWSFAGALVLASSSAMASVITFDPLVGGNGDSYTGHTEAGFNVAAVGGSWFEAHIFGNPVPSIYAGPIGGVTDSTISITRTDGLLFHFVSVDVSSNSANTGAVVVDGYLNGAHQYSGGFGFSSSSTFETKTNAFDFGDYNTLTIKVLPGSGVTSMNVDNIVLNPTPEPASMAILLGGVGLLVKRRRQGR